MNRNQRRSRLIALTVGCAVALPLLSLSASGAPSDGRFHIHAWNTEDPSIEAYAGLNGLKKNADGSWSTSPGSGTGAPGTGGGSDGGGDSGSGGETPGDTSPVAYETKAGPLTLKVTEDMLAFSEANRKAQEEGRTGDIKTDPDGWQTMWWYDFSSNLIKPGYSDQDGAYNFLSSSSEVPSFDDLNNIFQMKFGKMIALYTENKAQGTVQAVDWRGTPKAGNTYTYNRLAPNVGAEGRYMMSEDGLVSVYVIDNNGVFQVQRSAAVPNSPKYSSARFPYLVDYKASGAINSLSVRYPDKSRGYSDITVSDRSYLNEGESAIEYRDRVDGTGPKTVTLQDGQLVNAYYEDETGGHMVRVTSAAEYNAASGQNWDGKLEKFSDFDTSIPFRPSL